MQVANIIGGLTMRRTRARSSSNAAARPTASRPSTKTAARCSWCSPTAPTATAATARPLPRHAHAGCAGPGRDRFQPEPQPAVRVHPRSRPARCRRRRTGLTSPSPPARRPTPGTMAREPAHALACAAGGRVRRPVRGRRAVVGAGRGAEQASAPASKPAAASGRQGAAGAAAVEGLRRRQQPVPARFVPHAAAGRLPAVEGR